MTDIKQLDQDLKKLMDKKIELSQLDYNSEKYDLFEEELHDMEDAFNDNYGDYLEDILHEVHDEYCPDNDVLLPIAYLPKKATRSNDTYEVEFDQGVYVEVDDYASNETRLVLLPQPTRIILQIEPGSHEVVWQHK